jgi:uncharacterized protein (UPF0305 family)
MLQDLELNGKLSKTELLELLKLEARGIGLMEIMAASAFIWEDAHYIQESYRYKFVDSYMHAFITKITNLKDDKEIYNGEVNCQELGDAINLLREQKAQNDVEKGFNTSFFQIYMIISIYTTFVQEEPVHPVGTPFPGGFEVTHDGENYLCPVKESQKDNPGAVCGFCIAKQDESV